MISVDNTTVNGTIGSTSDTDYYRLTLPAGGTLVATLTPNASSDYDLYVYNSNGTLIGSSELGTGAVDTVTVTNTGTSAFVRYVRVVRFSGGTGATNGKYTREHELVEMGTVLVSSNGADLESGGRRKPALLFTSRKFPG